MHRNHVQHRAQMLPAHTPTRRAAPRRAAFTHVHNILIKMFNICMAHIVCAVMRGCGALAVRKVALLQSCFVSLPLAVILTAIIYIRK